MDQLIVSELVFSWLPVSMVTCMIACTFFEVSNLQVSGKRGHIRPRVPFARTEKFFENTFLEVIWYTECSLTDVFDKFKKKRLYCGNKMI